MKTIYSPEEINHLSGIQVLEIARQHGRNRAKEFAFRVVQGAGGWKTGERLVVQATEGTVWFEVDGVLFEESPKTFLAWAQDVFFEEEGDGIEDPLF